MTIAGIDLGTTNSLIALWTDEGPRLIANALGDTLTPSAVSIADDGAVLVGRAAVDRLVTHPDRSIASFKRWMGSGAGARLAGKFYRAEELSALVLRSLKEDAENQAGGAIGDTVISVPAYFSDPQRKATLDAARLAGLEVERLVNEPTAAALAHGLESVEEGRFLILDLGRRHVRRVAAAQVRGHHGGARVGGRFASRRRRFSRRAGLADRASRQASIPTRWPARGPRAADARGGADQVRADRAGSAPLTNSRSPTRPHAASRTRAEFEEAAQPLLRRLRAPIERAVADARVDPQAIDQIVLVGGATRMPMVRALAARLFGRFPLAHPRPDHVVALGAAVAGGPQGARRGAGRRGDDRRLPVHPRHFGARHDRAGQAGRCRR